MSSADTQTEPESARHVTTLRLDEALRTAMAQHQQGNLAAAASIYTSILDAVPDHADATHLLGVVALQRGDFATAEKMIRKACRANPAATNYHFNLGQTLIHAGRTLEGAELIWSSGAFEEAEAVCRKFLEAEPESVDAKVLQAQILGDLAGRAKQRSSSTRRSGSAPPPSLRPRPTPPHRECRRARSNTSNSPTSSRSSAPATGAARAVRWVTSAMPGAGAASWRWSCSARSSTKSGEKHRTA